MCRVAFSRVPILLACVLATAVVAAPARAMDPEDGVEAAQGQAPDAAQPPAAAQPAPTPAPPAAATNYYDRRASETLKQDEALARSPPHPLAAALPGYDVVVCEGGCADDREAEIVYKQRTTVPKVVTEGEMVPTSASGVAARPIIGCVAGCYDTPKSYPAPASLRAEPEPPAMPAVGTQR